MEITQKSKLGGEEDSVWRHGNIFFYYNSIWQSHLISGQKRFCESHNVINARNGFARICWKSKAHISNSTPLTTFSHIPKTIINCILPSLWLTQPRFHPINLGAIFNFFNKCFTFTNYILNILLDIFSIWGWEFFLSFFSLLTYIYYVSLKCWS